MLNHQTKRDSSEWTNDVSHHPLGGRNEVNRYRQMHSQPVATLIRSTDERPEIAEAIVLGYN